jgi:hypothetical protein
VSRETHGAAIPILGALGTPRRVGAATSGVRVGGLTGSMVPRFLLIANRALSIGCAWPCLAQGLTQPLLKLEPTISTGKTGQEGS